MSTSASCFSITKAVRLSAPSGLSFLTWAMLSPLPLSFFLHRFPFVPFPLLKSLCFFTLSSPSERADVGQLEHRSSQLRPLTMKDDKPRWEGLTSHRANLGPGAPLTRDLRGGCRFKPHLCSGSKSEHPNSLTFISWAEAADFCTLVYM